MTKKRIIVFTIDESSKRLERFQEEAKKRGAEISFFNTYRVQVTDSGIFYGGEKLEFSENDRVWFIANPMINHYLVEAITMKHPFMKGKMWPSDDATKYSDKFYTNCFFGTHEIPTPKTALINSRKPEKLDALVKYVGGFPCVIKSCKGSMGKNVELVKNADEIVEFIEKSMSAKGKVPFKKSSYLLQEFVEESAGSDFRVICLAGEVVGAINRKAEEGFKSNVSLGGKATGIDPDEELKELAETIIKKAELFYGGVDFIKSNGGYQAIEINSSAQFKGFERATGINMAGRIVEKLLDI